MNAPEHRALEAENGFALALMRGASELLALQALTQPEDVPALRAHVREATEIRVELIFGLHPHIRIVTVDSEGGDAVLLRRLDFAPGQAAG